MLETGMRSGDAMASKTVAAATRDPLYGLCRMKRAFVLLCVATLALCLACAGKAYADDVDLGVTFPEGSEYVSTDMGRNPAGKVGFNLSPSDEALTAYQAANPDATMKTMEEDWISSITSVAVGGVQLEQKAFSEWKSLLTNASDDAGKLNYCELTAYSSYVKLTLPVALFDTEQEFSTLGVVIEADGFDTVRGTVTYRNLGADGIVVRILSEDGTVQSTVTLTADQLQNLKVVDQHDTSANCGMAGLRSYCSQGVLLTDVLKAGGVDFSEGMTVKMRVNDELSENGDATTTETAYLTNAVFTYEDLLGTARYYYPAMWDTTARDELGGDSVYGILSEDMDAWKTGELASTLAALLGETKEQVYPVIAWSWNEGVVAWGGSDPAAVTAASGYNGYTDQSRFRLLFGMEANEDGSAADDNTTFSNVYAVFGIDVVADDGYRLFSDVATGTWYGPSTYYLYSLGLIRGYAGTDQFGVGNTLTRAELAAILWRYADPDAEAAYDQGSATNATGMSDVADGAWYTGAANWAVEAGVINGVENADGSRSFDPDGTVTFEQMITMLANLLADEGAVDAADTSTLAAFADGDQVSDWAANSLAWAYGKGFFSGNDNGDGTRSIKAYDGVARERVAAVLYNGFNEDLL